jgi:hypothetical protein
MARCVTYRVVDGQSLPVAFYTARLRVIISPLYRPHGEQHADPSCPCR